MNRLIINTANNQLAIILDKEGDAFLKTSEARMHHNETMLPLIDSLLTEHGLRIGNIDQFGVVIGPGSFTGIRVGIATIKAFRDALSVEARGINNLRLLFNLAKSQQADISTVAIAGSRDSYFVASVVNDTFYIFERNLTLLELKEVVGDGRIAMYEYDENLDPYVVEMDAGIVLSTLEESNDRDLVPVYYQLSQAESEKLKRGSLNITVASNDDTSSIAQLESENILVNTLSLADIGSMIKDQNYVTIKAELDNRIVGFLILQFTDEASVVSVAVDSNYRNVGMATKMFEYGYSIMKDRDVSVISLEVKYDNITAYNLYKKLGFEVRRRRKAYYADGQDCLEMFKTI